MAKNGSVATPSSLEGDTVFYGGVLMKYVTPVMFDSRGRKGRVAVFHSEGKYSIRRFILESVEHEKGRNRIDRSPPFAKRKKVTFERKEIGTQTLNEVSGQASTVLTENKKESEDVWPRLFKLPSRRIESSNEVLETFTYAKDEDHLKFLTETFDASAKKKSKNAPCSVLEVTPEKKS